MTNKFYGTDSTFLQNKKHPQTLIYQHLRVLYFLNFNQLLVKACMLSIIILQLKLGNVPFVQHNG